MNPIKIIFFDIDGTLVDSAIGRIPAKTYEALNRLREKGILLCIATGRPPASLPNFGELTFDAMLTFNGALCYTDTETIFSCPIPQQTVHKVIANVTTLGRPVSVAVRNRLVANGVEQDLADYYAVAGLALTVAEDFDEVIRQDVYQIMMGYRGAELEAITRGTQGVKIALSWERAADVISDGGGKGNGVRAILKHFHLDASQALAFGDSHNDMEMFQAVGTGIAMGNATERLKAIADAVCRPVSDDGIYHYCVDHGLF